MNGYLLFILGMIGLSYVLDLVVSLLNLRALDPQLPDEFTDVYDQEEYARSQEYTRVTTRFSLLQSTFMTALTILFILCGGFNLIDTGARWFGFSSIPTGLIFTSLLVLLSGMISLPFSIYSTFVIEERFGFNKTTPITFVLDLGKSICLMVLIGGPLLWFILWFFEFSGALAWLYCWAAMVGFVILFQFLAPVIIMPLFNKFVPLAEGELKSAIHQYAEEQEFRMKGIYTMDGSKRSTKLNAFFTGFGRFRRIVFFDTLVERLTTKEIVAVLAHEMGHFKLRHIFKMMAASMVQMGILFYILSLFINNRGLFDAFGMEHLSVYASLVFFSFLYAPISSLLAVVFNYFSRLHEYQADRFAKMTTGHGEHLVNGLKKLSISNLSNLTPHSFNVFLNYSHPPVLERIHALRANKEQR